MILTYGNRHGGAAELAEKLCEDCGIKADYINVIMMADNWLPSFDMEEQKKIDKKVEEHMDEILADLKVRKRMISEVTDIDRAAHQQSADRMSQMPSDAWQHLIRVTDAYMPVLPKRSGLPSRKKIPMPGTVTNILPCRKS